jgi:secreted pullulanase
LGEEIIYFMLTDRFADGDPSNNNPYNLDYDGADNQRGVYQGGDFKGVTENLDYLDELGISTIWITPIVENVGHDVGSEEAGEYYGYHGYWAKSFEELNPHLGTLEEFHELIDSAAERNISIMVDVVLNHAGYGMHQNDGMENPPEGYPTDEDRAQFEGKIRENSGGDDLTMELDGLPDFETERLEVTEQLVDWQASWVKRSTTPSGNAIASYRVDTVKHVDDTTWQHFKNELVERDPAFKLIGESWGANYRDDQGYLNTGTMDSLLDFGFKDIASNFVNGRLESANTTLIERNETLASDATLGQFLSSHDEHGFLYTHDNDEGKQKLAASLQITAKGQPVIYYGEELGQSGANNWPLYDNRYDFGWDIIEDNDMLDHYQSLLSFRNEFSELLSRGSRRSFLTSEDEDWIIVERALNDESVYMAFNVSDEAQTITIETDSEEAVLTDHYSLETYEAMETEETNLLTFTIPAMEDGGTALLTIENGELIRTEVEVPEETSIEEGYFRIHFETLLNDNLEDMGLWLFNDAADPSDNWPTGALPFTDAVETDFGYYMDFELAEKPERIGLLINSYSGQGQTDDVEFTLLAPEMNEAWVTEDWELYAYEPLADEDVLRVNYQRENADYEGWALWTWGDVLEATTDWLNGAHDFDSTGLYGNYYDLDLAPDASTINFLIANKNTEEQTGNMEFSQLNHTQVFVREGDDRVYTNPFFVSEEGLLRSEMISENQLELVFESTEGLTEEILRESIVVTGRDGTPIDIDAFTLTIDNERNVVVLEGEFNLNLAPYTVTFDGRETEALMGWRLKDSLYAYDGELGLDLHDDGTATIKVWSPSADAVRVVLYDKDNQDTIIRDDIEMEALNRGVWEATLNEETSGIADLTGYFYHFEIERDGETVLALDPYARSLAAWDSSNPDNHIAKAAIVNPSNIGPELDYATIEGYEKREDAIIYEIHVRDFTSDPSLEEELDSQFGTFSAFIEKLDYIESLGVTHIQMLPVMSYFFANEFNNDERMLDYQSTDTNYNWGYDPQSYFSLTGMYSENPEDPAKRIEEFKQLVDEIHARGMGVILDVVYNHTARVHIFEDLEPNYYHFMNLDGTPRESFGGGRLGTTHEMSRRILVDSITYWVEEYKIDGFRFDMMGDHDAETIQIAYDEAKALNPNVLMIGEGWVTYAGDEGYEDVQAADQNWMQDTQAVGSFSDDFRNELKSGFGSEGEPRFLTGGARSVQRIYDNLTANPGNFTADDPGDVVPYIAAHDNLTLHDVIAQSIQKDPEYHQQEIHERIRLGNLMVLTAQGTPFIHAGQEFGRTKQFRDPDYMEPVSNPPYKSTFMTDEEGNPFVYPYFIHDSYDSTDAINMFDWAKATNAEEYPINTTTQSYTAGLIELRRSTDAFRKGTMEEVSEMVSLVDVPEISEEDLAIVYSAEDSNGDTYYVFVNADEQQRTFTMNTDLTTGDIIVDATTAGTEVISNPNGIEVTADTITVDALTASVIRVSAENVPGEPGDPGDEEPEIPEDLAKLIAELERRIETLEAELAAANEANEALEAELAELERLLASLQAELGETNDTLSDLEARLNELEDRLAALEQQDEDADQPGDGEEEEPGETGEGEPGDNGSSDEGSDGTDTVDEDSGERLPSTATMVGAIGALGVMTLGIGAGLKYLNKKKK